MLLTSDMPEQPSSEGIFKGRPRDWCVAYMMMEQVQSEREVSKSFLFWMCLYGEV